VNHVLKNTMHVLNNTILLLQYHTSGSKAQTRVGFGAIGCKRTNFATTMIFQNMMVLMLWSIMQTQCQNGEHNDAGDAQPDTGGNTNSAGISDETYKTRMQKLYNKMDMNADGKLSLTEIVQFSLSDAAKIHARDKNEDGKLTLDEWDPPVTEWEEQVEKMRKQIVEHTENKSADELDENFAVMNQTVHDTIEEGYAKIEQMKKTNKEMFGNMDKNNDGTIDENEFALDEKKNNEMFLTVFSSLDLNGDGKFDLKEFYRYSLQNGESDEHSIAKLFADLDVDGDGELNREEVFRHRSQEYHVHAAFGPMFVKKDANNDSLLTLDEFHEHPKSDAVAKFLKEWTWHHHYFAGEL